MNLVLGLALSLSVLVMGNEIMARTSESVRIHFFEKPIPQGVYKKARNFALENGSFHDSFFLAKIQVVGYRATENRRVEEITMNIIEVIEGEIPKKEFFVKRSISTIENALPENPVKQIFFIMGELKQGDLVMHSASVRELRELGYFKEN